MKKVFLLPVMLLFAVLITSCSKKDDAEIETEDKSIEVSQTYQGQLKLGNNSDVLNTYDNVKIKVTRKGVHEVTLEPVSDQGYPSFTPITYSKFLFSSQSNAYASSNPGSIIFTFTSAGSIDLRMAYSLASTAILFEGANVK